MNGRRHLEAPSYTGVVDPYVAALVSALVAFGAGAAVGMLSGRARSRAESGELARASERAREEARIGREELRSMVAALSAMQEGVLLFGPGGATTYTNPAIERHLGSVPASVDALLPVGLRGSVRSAAMTHLAAEVEAETGSPTRWLRASATPVGDDDSVLLVVRDVTEARRLEAVRRDFVANASHELKTPLASILAAAETIQSAAADDPAVLPRFAALLEKDAARLSRIVSDLLDLSRLEGGSETDASVALDAIALEETERFEPTAEDTGVTLTITSEPASVRGSARDLALLVRNLVDNALRYTGEGGSVAVDVRIGDEEIVLSVEDSGIGIPTRDLPRIFERFYRVDRARSRETGGTGLGLAIVKHVVENHGGRISVESELGRGTRFEVRLPAAG